MSYDDYTDVFGKPIKPRGNMQKTRYECHCGCSFETANKQEDLVCPWCGSDNPLNILKWPKFF